MFGLLRVFSCSELGEPECRFGDNYMAGGTTALPGIGGKTGKCSMSFYYLFGDYFKAEVGRPGALSVGVTMDITLDPGGTPVGTVDVASTVPVTSLPLVVLGADRVVGGVPPPATVPGEQSVVLPGSTVPTVGANATGDRVIVSCVCEISGSVGPVRVDVRRGDVATVLWENRPSGWGDTSGDRDPRFGDSAGI